FWTDSGHTQQRVEQPVDESLRGGFTLRVTSVRENRTYLDQRVVQVPWSNKNLSVKWEHFRSKLEPGRKETWTAIISGPDSKSAAAEMIAALYDASLDQYQRHRWSTAFDVFRYEYGYGRDATFANRPVGFWPVITGWTVPSRSVDLGYRSFPPEILADDER